MNSVFSRKVNTAVKPLGLAIVTALLVSPAFIMPAVPVTAQSTPAAPLMGFPITLNHYDHHWYYWLPRHPQFEAMEVMSADRPGGQPLVWVFFTERAGAKRQHHYINDSRIAAAIGWTHRDIRFASKGGPGEARSLDVSLNDGQGRLVEATMEFAPGTLLSNKERRGLTDQSGHSRDALFMIFYRDRQAPALNGVMKLAGVNHAILPGEPLGTSPGRYTNSGNIYIGAISYGRREIPAGELSVQPLPGDGRAWTRSTRFGVTTVSLDAQENMVESKQAVGRNTIFTRFDPAVPSCRPGAETVRADFTTSINIDPNIIEGQVTRRCEGADSVLEFRPRTPTWAAGQPFAVRQTSSATGGIVFQTTPLRS